VTATFAPPCCDAAFGNMTEQRYGPALLLCAAAMAALCAMDAVVKAIGASLPTVEVVFVRFTSAVLWLAVFVAVTKGRWPQLRNWKRHALRGSLIAGTATLYFYAVGHLPLAIATALAMSAPVYVSIFGIVFLKEKPSLRLLGAVLLGLLGTLVIASGGNTSHSALAADGWAWLAGVAAPIAYAASMVTLKHHSGDEDGAPMILGQSAVAATIVLPFAAPVMVLPEGSVWGLIALVGLLGGGGFVLLLAGIRQLPASVFALVDYTSLLWAALYGYLFFSEMPEPRLWIGGALIIAACALGLPQKPKPAAALA